MPHRPDVSGGIHTPINNLVLRLRTTITNCIGHSLTRVDEKAWFKKDKVFSSEIVDWAISKNIGVPAPMIRAAGKALKSRREWQYTTPQLKGVFWVIDNFWEGIDPATSAKQQDVVSALRKQFPDLTNEECVRIDRITRHPSVKTGRRKKT